MHPHRSSNTLKHRSPGASGTELLALVLSDIITFTYHYPRNHLMFDAPLTVEPERLSRAAGEWAAANLLRVALVLGCWLATLISLLRLGPAGQST